MQFSAKQHPLIRLYHISIGSALFLLLPVVILICWISVNSFLEYSRFNNIALNGNGPAFNTEIFHLYLKKSLIRAYIRATAPEMPENDTLPLIQLSIDPESLAELNSDLPASGKSKYYSAVVSYNGKTDSVKARYMGDNHWNWLYHQKSWRIKTKKKNLINGSRKINLKNPRRSLTFNECIAQDLATEVGLIAPRVFPIKFVVNNIYTGVYLFWDPVDESVIRRFKRMPGSVYSGDGAPVDPKTGISLLWREDKHWKKIASRNTEETEYRSDIREFIRGVNQTDLMQFYSFVEKYINKDAYATYLSVDNVTASWHHDYHHNHKYYFDPILGKFEPISWDIDGWALNRKEFDPIGSPLQNKWKLIPEFHLFQKKRLYNLIKSGVLSTNQILKKTETYDLRIRNALKADVYRDQKYSRAVSVLKFPNSPCFPFSMDSYGKQIERFKKGIKRRISLLEAYLDKSDMSSNLLNTTTPNMQILRVISYGTVGRRITGIKLSGDARNAKIVKDINRNQRIDEADIFLGSTSLKSGSGFIQLDESALPGFKKLSINSQYPRILFGDFQLVVSPLEYGYFIQTIGGIIDDIEIQSENIVTGKSMQTSVEAIPEQIANDTISLHPWDLPPKPKNISTTMGPGNVDILRSTVFDENVSVSIQPGTTVRIAKGASLFFYGKVTARGTKEKPIRFQAIDPEKPWGVFVLQGKKTSGSSFEFCSWEGGSQASKDLIFYSGMISIHGSENLVFRNCYIGKNYKGDDSLHLAYSTNFRIEGCLFENSNGDALDIDISNGSVRFSRFNNSGNDAVDLMTSKVVITDSVVVSTGDKGVSVGENSRLSLERSVFEKCEIGIQIKDRSSVNYGQNIIKNSSVAIQLNKKNWRYDGGGILKAINIFAVNCMQNIKMDKHSKATYDSIQTNDPKISVFDHAILAAGKLVPMTQSQ